MTLRIDRVESEIEVTSSPLAPAPAASGSATDTLANLRGGAALREKLYPIVMDILNEELMRIKRKVGAP